MKEVHNWLGEQSLFIARGRGGGGRFWGATKNIWLRGYVSRNSLPICNPHISRKPEELFRFFRFILPILKRKRFNTPITPEIANNSNQMFTPTTASYFVLFSLEKTLSKYHTNIVSLYFTYGCSHAKRWHIISSYFSRLQRHNRTFGLRLSLDSLLGQKKFVFTLNLKPPPPPPLTSK